MNDLELLARIHARGVSGRWDPPAAKDWAPVLATFPLFTGVSHRRLRKLADTATLAEFAPGQTIIFAGRTDDLLHILLSGHARSTSRSDRRVRGVGEYFGEMAMIDGRPHPASVIAMSYVHVMKLPSGAVRKLAHRHPAITIALLRGLIARFRLLEQDVASAANG